MITFNIWMRDDQQVGPTGPWKFMAAVIAPSESEAIETAKMRYGLNGEYKIYEGLQ